MVHLRKTGDGDGKIRVEVDPTHFSKAKAEGRHTDDTGAPSRRHPCGGGGERDRHVRYVLRRPPPPPGLLGIQACAPPHLWLRPRARREGWERQRRRARGKVLPRVWDPEAWPPLHGDRKEDRRLLSQQADLGHRLRSWGAGRGWNSACWGWLRSDG